MADLNTGSILIDIDQGRRNANITLNACITSLLYNIQKIKLYKKWLGEIASKEVSISKLQDALLATNEDMVNIYINKLQIEYQIEKCFYEIHYSISEIKNLYSSDDESFEYRILSCF